VNAPPGSDPKHRALIALLVTAPAPSIGALVAFHLAPGAVGNAVYLLGKGVLYGMPLIWLCFVVREPFGLSPLRKGGLGFGALSGAALGVFILAIYGLWARDALDPAPLLAAAARSGFDTPGRYLLMSLGLSTVNALLEEYAFRWFLYGRCRTLFGVRRGAIIGALVFTAHHVIVLRTFFDWPIVLLGSAGVFVGGLVWTWCYERYGSIWPGFLSHVLADVAIMAIGWDLMF